MNKRSTIFAGLESSGDPKAVRQKALHRQACWSSHQGLGCHISSHLSVFKV